MTVEIGTHAAPAPVSGEGPSAATQALLAAVRSGEAGAPLLRALLGDTKLPPDQQAFVDLLLELQERPDAADAPVVAEDGADEIRAELANLREANDTVAAALGACPYCWGGNAECAVCRGRGRSGYREPDPALFNELVMPAVQRVRSLKRSAARPRSGPLRV
jgi:hypothetical protein